MLVEKWSIMHGPMVRNKRLSLDVHITRHGCYQFALQEVGGQNDGEYSSKWNQLGLVNFTVDANKQMHRFPIPDDRGYFYLFSLLLPVLCSINFRISSLLTSGE